MAPAARAVRAALASGEAAVPLLLRAVLRRAAATTSWGSRVLVALDRAAGSGGRATWDEVGPALVADPPALLSVDIFDTVLTRPLVGQDALLLAAGAALVDARATTAPPERFLEARTRAAAALPRAPLEELYRHPQLTALGLAPSAWEIEDRVEAALLRPVPGAAAALAGVRAAGVPLVFLTDLHLHRDVLCRALRAHDLAQPGDELIISSEVGSAKSDGALFAQLPTERRHIVHVGNDLWSDVAMAERAGIRGVPLGAAEPTELEALLGRRAGTSGPAIAAAARHARLAASGEGRHADALVETGADVAGQCFSAFLLWVRETCVDEGIHDVAFLARDGELLLQMARAMPADHWSGFTLDYLRYASRRAWTVAAAAALGIDAWMAVGNADDRSFINTSRHVVPFRSLLQRIALEPEDLGDHPPLATLDPAAPLPTARDGAWQELLADPAVRERIAERAAASHALLVEHLEQIGIGDRRLGLVDVGWRGQLAWMLSTVLRDITGADPVHLHFGGANVAAAVHGEVDIRRFAVDDSVAPLPFPHMVSCVETFTASGGARALGLERDDRSGEVRMVLGGEVAGVRNAAREIVWATAVDTAAALPPRAVLRRWGITAVPLDEEVRAVLTSFWTEPSRRHALAGSRLCFEVDDAGTVVGPVAAPYRVGELREDHPAPRQWREGSLRLTPQPARALFAAALQMRDRRAGAP
jgi:FMN phosphatase YigB (HAD superfamily)